MTILIVTCLLLQLPSQARQYVTKQIGDRTECAMLRFLRELGRNYESIRKQFPKEKFVKVYAYNSVSRARSTVVQMPNGAYMLFSMGPADTLLQRYLCHQPLITVSYSVKLIV